MRRKKPPRPLFAYLTEILKKRLSEVCEGPSDIGESRDTLERALRLVEVYASRYALRIFVELKDRTLAKTIYIGVPLSVSAALAQARDRFRFKYGADTHIARCVVTATIGNAVVTIPQAYWEE